MTSPHIAPRLRFLAAALAVALAGAAPAAASTTPPEETVGEEKVLASPATFQEEPGAADGHLMVQSRPVGARVFVNGEDRGVTPLRIQDLGPGAHEVILYVPGRGAHRQVVERAAGRIFVDLEAEATLGVGLVTIVSTPPDARVEVDGQGAGRTPLELPLLAGSRVVRLTRPGYKDRDMQLAVKAETAETVEVALEPREGHLLVIASPAGAEVLLGGRKVGRATEPLRLENIKPGQHEVRVEQAGFRPWVRGDVVVRSDETTTVLAALVPERDHSWVRLFVEPPGVKAWLDGEELGVVGPDGFGFKARKGAHSLRLEANPAVHPGYLPLQITVNFAEDDIDYRESPLRLPQVDQNFVHGLGLIARGQREEALAFLDRVPPTHDSFAEARLLSVDCLRELGRVGEIPAELTKLTEHPQHSNNPALRTALGYWSLMAAREAKGQDAVAILERGMTALDAAGQGADLLVPALRQPIALRTHYYAGLSSEALFHLTGDRRHVKKGLQSWEVFFARLELAPKSLGEAWIDRARSHRQTMEYLAKKLGD